MKALKALLSPVAFSSTRTNTPATYLPTHLFTSFCIRPCSTASHIFPRPLVQPSPRLHPEPSLFCWLLYLLVLFWWYPLDSCHPASLFTRRNRPLLRLYSRALAIARIDLLNADLFVYVSRPHEYSPLGTAKTVTRQCIYPATGLRQSIFHSRLPGRPLEPRICAPPLSSFHTHCKPDANLHKSEYLYLRTMLCRKGNVQLLLFPAIHRCFSQLFAHTSPTSQRTFSINAGTGLHIITCQLSGIGRADWVFRSRLFGGVHYSRYFVQIETTLSKVPLPIRHIDFAKHWSPQSQVLLALDAAP